MLPFSQSTSRLELATNAGRKPERLSRIPEHSTVRRPCSSEGRFSIIDSKFKTNSSSDEDEMVTLNSKTVGHSPSSRAKTPIIPLHSCLSPNKSKDFSPPLNDLKIKKTVDFSLSNSPTMVTGSRFRIVPVESRYKRGRWSCHDYYDPSEPVKNGGGRSCPPTPLSRPDHSIGLNHPKTAPHDKSTAFVFDHKENSKSFSQTTPNFSRPNGRPIERKQATATPLNNTQRAILIRSLAYDKDGKYTPSEVLQSGLENTLDLAHNKKDNKIRFEPSCLH
ncbi:unnamed protein product, partial [Mesorhabditis belari]|uniref:TSC22 domain family protein 1 n=1 Tax=Mesorhabditis belari TaxID=2138241 RepID=A0AAF3EUM9_9BILA